MSTTRIKVLFFAEGATLAHVARPYVVADALDAAQFEISFARPESFAWLTADAKFRTLPLWSQDSATFTRRLDRGQPLYDLDTLERYVADDLVLIAAEKPDVVVGDFRLSLAVSARLRAIPYATICDAYWSPERPFEAPLPALAFTRFTPIPLASAIFRTVAPLAFRLHAHPIECLRARHGLPSLRHDLRRCYTDADLRLYANFPQIFPEVPVGPHAAFIGPIAWSPAAPTEPIPFLDGKTRPIYVTMGSSGDPRVLGALLPVLNELDLPVLVATASKPLPAQRRSDRLRIFDYLPGGLVCQHAQLVICNGGSPTTNQALASGVPVLGIARNMDQFLNMGAIARFGAGTLLRADRASPDLLRPALAQLLQNDTFVKRTSALSMHSAQLSSVGNMLDQILRTISLGN